jgi:FkbM family methyltransferase
MEKDNKKVVVLDMQPIDPPLGGGRLRLLGLYHNLGEYLPTQYIGTYDWPGEKFRDHKLSSTFREVDIPLSDEHFTECRKWQERVGGKTIIDTTFPQLAHLSPQYVNYVRNEVVEADAIIISHPWVYPLIKDLLNKDTQTVIYDSHNVEGYLRFTLLDDGGFGTEIVRNVVKTELELCQFSDVIFACSFEDCKLFNMLYNIPFNKMKIVPNGVFTEKTYPVDDVEKKTIKQQLGLGDRKAAIFIGSNYSPNLEACNFIIKDLAPILPDITFIIAGGVGEGINKNISNGLKNVIITGSLSEKEKLLYLTGSDIAINPMFSGSGTNIKMFDFMAAGLPIITTEIGARGITKNDYVGIVICNKSGFISSLQDFANNDEKSQRFGDANRELAERNFSWEKISPKLGKFLTKTINKKNNEQNKSETKSISKKFALMSSWNMRCGIAEHSRYLATEFDEKNIDFCIIANSNGDLASSHLIDDLTKNVYPLWNYDYLKWKDTSIDIAEIIQSMKNEKISRFNIQYHTGFFNQKLLMELINACVNAKIKVSIALHNSKEMYPEILTEMNKLGIKIIVHTFEEEKLLQDKGVQNVFHIPLGVLDFPDEEKKDCRIKFKISEDPVIGCFGFLRPHKGVLEAIEAISILKDRYPNIKLLGINALYPSEDSEQYLRTCIERIDELKVNDNITLITNFLEMKQIIHYLHASDVILLPYHDSKEGSSAAANTAISAKRPLVISNSGIFSEIRHVSHVMESIDPPIIASKIQNLLYHTELLDELKEKAVNYVIVNSYAKIAEQYVNLIFGDEIDFESILQEVYESILDNGDIAIDIGAHIGRHTIPIAKKIIPNGRVYAFEPLPSCQKQLLKSIKNDSQKLTKIITVYPNALSDYEGESDFTIVKDDLAYSGLIERKLDHKSTTEKIKVTVKKLDNLVTDIDNLKYIKIDAEGGEFNILKGGSKIISKFRPVVTFEFGASSYMAYSVIPEQVFLFWHELNYNIYDILGKLLDSEDSFAQSSINQKIWDYIAIPAENLSATEKVLRVIM